MIAQPETIKKTRLFGLNTYEAKIWIALLSREVSTAGELSDIANVPRSRSYDVLESLEKKGFIVMKLGKPIKYIALPPKEVLENIKKKVEYDTGAFLDNIGAANFNKIIYNLQQIHEKNTGEQENMIAVIKGRENIYKHLSYILHRAKKEVFLSFVSSNNLITNAVEKLKSSSNLIVKTANLRMRACVTDEHNVLVFPISEDDTHPDYDMCIWIKNKDLAKFLKSLISIRIG